jgi:hypothetical protein
MDSPQQSSLPGPILKDRRAWWLYLIPIITVAALPLVVVLGLFLLSWARVEMSGELVTAVVSLAATALGGIVNRLLASEGGDGSNGQ